MWMLPSAISLALGQLLALTVLQALCTATEQATCVDDPEYIHEVTGFNCESWRGGNCLNGVLLFEEAGDSRSKPLRLCRQNPALLSRQLTPTYVLNPRCCGADV